MKNLWRVLLGILIAIVSLGLVLGGLSLSLAEGQLNATRAPTEVQSATPSLSSTPTSTPPSTPTSFSPTPEIASLTPTLTIALPSPTGCPPPPSWVAYTVESGDTLSILAARYHVTVTVLQQANCLSSSSASLKVGSTLYVPPAPTMTRVPCGAPSGWVTIIIQPGDTLYHLSLAYGVSVAQLQRANCMGSSTVLVVGDTFFVPPGPTRTPSETLPELTPPTEGPTPTETGTVTPTATEPGFFPTNTPTNTPSP